ncbi:MAG: LacI family DNA-binding transcriptional regulator, partial [Cellulomonas sp.]
MRTLKWPAPTPIDVRGTAAVEGAALMPIEPAATGRAPGRDAPTLDQVARVAGVSRATASRVVNGESRVSPAARSAVERAVVTLGYRPNRA